MPELTQLLLAVLLTAPLVYVYARTLQSRTPSGQTDISENKDEDAEGDAENSDSEGEPKSIMQPENSGLAPPKDDPFTLEQLKEYDGSNPDKPIYVAIKGTIFDVTAKSEMYGPGKSYNIFAGKDGSKGLGKSSLKEEDAVPDYSDLPESELKVLDEWHSFFSKRYNIVGRVTGLPETVARSS